MAHITRGLTAASFACLILLTGGAAGAHVEPAATEVAAGSYATVDFTVEHGCEESPTVKVEFQIPDELDDVVPVAQDGWTTSVEADVVRFEGGPLPADQEASFSVSFTAPQTQGVTLTFPFIQTCEEGSIDWIQTTSDAERPAPVVRVGAPDPTAPTGPPTTTTAAPSTTSTTAESTTSGAPTDLSTPSEPTGTEAADDGASPWLAVVGVIVVTAAIVGGVIVLRRRGD